MGRVKFKGIHRKKWFKITSLLFGLLTIYWVFCLPKVYFEFPTSTIIESKNGDLLSAKIANDGQWRFPLIDSVPKKFKHCIVQFEDRRFDSHWGISLKALARAIYQNISEKRVVSGGSTITMQTVRLMRKNPPRTIWQKVIEGLWATRLEFKESKNDILRYYATYAPFGGNVVGLETASWRYYGKPSHQLTWAQSATLAVLPNAPSLIFPGKNHDLLLKKRNRLLKRLLEIKIISEETFKLSLLEKLPQKPHPLPQHAPHLLNFVSKNSIRGEKHQTSINYNLQLSINKLLRRHSKKLRRNNINNIAVLVTNVKTGKILSYHGNVSGLGFNHNEAVDVVQSPRSSGSILKPFLYCQAFDEGFITPYTLLPDVPTHYKGYTPQNYVQSFAGAVPANKCLAQSLNIPAVRLLEKVELNNFYHKLKSLEIKTINRPAQHYGLSLVLGGAETCLWDLNKAYRKMAWQANQSKKQKTYPKLSYKPEIKTIPFHSDFNEGAINLTFNSMLEVIRPGDESNWKVFSSARKVAWKTGTSFGYRDAWAIGITPEYVVSVWVGNATGEGRPGIIGVKAAAPILFDIYNLLPSTSWFKEPVNDFKTFSICKESGYKASKNCPNPIRVELNKQACDVKACPYHKLIHLNKEKTHQVNSDCYNVFEMEQTKWFILPGLMEHYYKSAHANYKVVPPLSENCVNTFDSEIMKIIYPKKISRIHIPINLNNELEKVSFEATHREKNGIIYWHIDENFVGSTQTIHQINIQPSVGEHTLKLVDNRGNVFVQKFSIY
ncbi:MAG: penicillin-binding protein 1C [Flavobacteriales bacterium]|nr:penicillin-binding protein 1C [Flavobacteriales bacterium]